MRVMSFGFRYGPPDDPRLAVYDASWIPDPATTRAMKARTGFYPAIGTAVLSTPGVNSWIMRIIGECREPGVAIGCSAGRHRSVVIAAVVAGALGVVAEHRDIERSGAV